MGTALSRARFLEAYEMYADTVFRLCLSKTSNREVALDLTQQTFTNVWDYIAKGGEIKSMRGFTFTVVRNLIKDHYKKKRPLYEHELAGTLPDVAYEGASLEWEAEAGHLITLIRRLGDDHREVLMLHYLESMSVKDIATLLDERENTISVRLNRALKNLRNLFDGER